MISLEIMSFFENIKGKSAKEVKKIKKLAMAHNIQIKEKRKLFCKKCFVPYDDFSLTIKNDMVRIVCGNCENVSRWKFK